VAPFASIRGDEGQPIALGDQTNVQDGVVIHALETTQAGMPLPNRTYQVNGKEYAVYIGQRVSLAHQSQVHGPARVDDGVFIGMQALVFKSSVGTGSVVEPGAKLIGVSVPAGRYVPAGSVITDQAVADKLPVITPQYVFSQLNDAVVHVNTSFARGYNAAAESARADSGSQEGPREAKGAKIAAAQAEHPKPEGH
jgi:carbonic anhydrase/acetyltransferase-like protein (isoleucine patch superfamily)